MAVATTKKLSTLHGKLADTFTHALTSEIERMDKVSMLMNAAVTDDNAEAVMKVLELDTSKRVDTGLLKTIASFLKDNSITSDLGTAEGESALDAKLSELQEKRKARVRTTPLDGLH